MPRSPRSVLRSMLAVNLLLFSASVSTAQDATRTPAVAFGIHWGVEVLTLPRVGQRVERVPERLRQLPSHPGDTWIYGPRQVIRTIPLDSIEPTPASTLIAFRAGPEVSLRRLRLRTGLSFALLPSLEPGLVKASTGATRLVNQRDQPTRGAGASVVYYNMFLETSPRPGWFAEASADLTKNLALFAGMGFDHLRLIADVGYDRFDRFEHYERRVAGRIRLRGTHGGVLARVPFAPGQSFGIRLAVGQIADPIETNGMTVSTAGRWYAVLGVSLQHIVLRRD